MTSAPVHPPTPQGFAPPPIARRDPGVTRWVLLGIVLAHTLIAFAQAALAGSYLSGDVDSIVAHGLNGSLLPLISMIQLVAAVLFWRPGRGPGWPAVATVMIFFVEGVQIGLGYSRSLAAHVPLGVALIAGLTVLSVRMIMWRPTRTTRLPAR